LSHLSRLLVTGLQHCLLIREASLRGKRGLLSFAQSLHDELSLTVNWEGLS